MLVAVPHFATALPYAADTTEVNLRQPSRQQLHKYKQDEAFDYGRQIQSEQSLLQRVIEWLQKKMGQFTDQAPVQYILKTLLYLCIIGLVLLLINQLMRGNLGSLFKQMATKKPMEMTVRSQQGDGTDWDKLIQQAIRNKDYGLAIHYLYQQRLAQLQQQQYITLRQHKTNHDYLNEINSSKLRGIFRELLHYYQYSEYGDFVVSEEDFKQIQAHFDKMDSVMNTMRQ